VKALVLRAFGSLAVEEFPDPVAAAGEVVVRTVATGICGSDIHGYTGVNGRRVPGQVMGHETVGRIHSVGAGVTGFTVGETVTYNPVIVPERDLASYAGREQHSPGKYIIGVAPDVVAAFAQFVAVPARNVVALPATMPIAYGALVEPLAVALHAVRRLSPEAGDGVLVLGGGPIGQSVVLALQLTGVERIAVSEVAPARRELIESLGAVAIDPLARPLPEQVSTLLGSTADAAIDAVGVSATMADALAATRLGARICLVGMGSQAIELPAFLVSTEERTIVGSFTYSAADFRDAAEWLATAPAAAGRLISREVPLADADAAFRGLAAGDGTPGKVLVRLDA
jgi:threonine dehydrogenase-like Zn-dependent dehydrogenase